jgi:hypothetical protein
MKSDRPVEKDCSRHGGAREPRPFLLCSLTMSEARIVGHPENDTYGGI